ncbi:hypothetical protein EF294_15000 [Gordonia oryzae]|uniref:Type VII secretion-associated protein n=1 Tax=Gordonia oryzae TaxID=2487349 RepID=A0A3N4G6S7_9ACTN|nr:hypothetical protein [Gordonia oryzae]RPA58493.1 hypothetical protein EF294_15000 [Gordonia oryzae]
MVSEAPEISIAEPAVLGVSVVGDDIATVVRDATGEIVASNYVELADESPNAALDALRELVDSAPFAIDHIALTCARPDVRAHLEFSMNAPGAPEWASAVSFVDLPHALAQVAHRDATGDVAAVVLDRSGALASGASIALVNAEHSSVLASAAVAAPQSVPLTDPQGAGGLVAHLNSLTRGAGATRVVAAGSGAQLPDAVRVIETATGASVAVAAAPVFAVAQSVTEVIAADTRAIPVAAAAVGPAATASVGTAAAAPTTAATGGVGLRWWIIGGAAGLAALLCVVALVALFSGKDGADTPAAVTSTVTVPGPNSVATVTRSGQPDDTQTVVDQQTVTSTVTQPPVTSTATLTVTSTATATATATVTEQETVTSVVTTTVSAPQLGPGNPGAGG